MRRHRTKLAVLALFLAASLLSMAGPASAASSGQACKKAGVTATSKSGTKTTYLLCAKVGKKLLWVDTKPPATTTVPVFGGGSCTRVGNVSWFYADWGYIDLLCAKVGTKKLWVEVAPKQHYTCNASGIRNPPSSSSCQVGDSGPGGGIVFYVAVTPFTATGTTCNTACRYLETVSKSWEDPVVGFPSLPWATTFAGCYGTSDAAASCLTASIYLSASATASRTAAKTVGMGMTNTTAIVARHAGVAPSTYAAGLADALTFGGKSDWYLPSEEELKQLERAKGIWGGRSGYYWSSSEEIHVAYPSYVQFGNANNWPPTGKAGLLYVRPIRAF